MSAFENLPYKLTVRIVKEIAGAKLGQFDSVAVSDLQNLRLVSERFNELVTPLLFESMIWDHRFLRHKDIHRMIKFVNLFPHLANCVKNLLIRVPPDNATPAIDDLETTRTYLRVTGITEAKSLTNAEEDVYHRIMVGPLALWKTLSEDDTPIQERAIGRVYWETFQRLPNLHHIETTLSTHYYECLSTASDIVATKLGVWVEDFGHNAKFREATALTSGYALVLASCPLRVNSLKFRQVPLMEDLPGWCPIPLHIQHLDIEFKIVKEHLTEGDGQYLLGRAIQEWQEQLRSLRLIRTLCIDFCGTWDEVNELALLKENSLSIEKLLPGTNGAAFPYLASLTLRNVPAHPFALIDLLTAHQSTLKSLFLHRISLDIGPDVTWAQVGTKLAEILPDLAYLELWRIGTHWVGWHNEDGEIVEEGDEDALHQVVAHQLLDEDEIEIVYGNAGWGWAEDVELEPTEDEQAEYEQAEDEQAEE